MFQEKPGWNTYDPLGMNRIVRFPELYEIRFSVFAPDSAAYTSKFYFVEHFGDVGNALRAGPHAVDCSYASVDLSFAGLTFRLEYAASEDGSLACCFSPIAVADPFTLILVEVTRPWGLDGDVSLEDGIISCGRASGGRIRITATQEYSSAHNPGTPVSYGVYASEEDFLQSLSEQKTLNGVTGRGKLAALGFLARIPLKVVAWGEEKSAQVQVNSLFAKVDPTTHAAEESHARTSSKITGGSFEGCCEAVSAVANWMTVWDQLHGLSYNPVTRSWTDNYMVRAGFDVTARGPLTGLWDSFFHAMLHSVNDKYLAEANIRVALGDHAFTEEGFPTNYVVSSFKSGDRSQPPIGSLAVWKVYRRFGDSGLLEWAYPRLKRWHHWWKTQRDGNRDGLLEWGSNAYAKEPGNEAGTLFAAKCESGMDNSPLYDEAAYDPVTGTMNLSDVGLNALYAADSMFLAKVAGTLGKTDDEEVFRAEYDALCQIINLELWDDKVRAYLDKFWSGDFSKRLGPTTFYPLLARIPDAMRAKELVQTHLLNEGEFWGEFVIPAISRNDPAFSDQLYWRGRVWPSVNYLVYLGLKAYRFDEAAYELAYRSARLFMKEWRLRGHCHENYNAITGEGCDVPIAASPGSNGSDRFYTWGALLALMGIEELFDVEMDKGIRFGCRFIREECLLRNVLLDGDSYNIKVSHDETRAFRNGDEFFSSSAGITIRNYAVASGTVEFVAAGNEKTSFRITEFQPHAPVTVRIGEHSPFQAKADGNGSVSFEAETDPSVRITLTGVLKR